ncbi:MAG: hypothetical protein EP330_02290 [Deltaproteobacteria bacterium]|nr:MAG: hypothetical protein EP330_02290 [Deltaproteobacteria bacterium]
MRAIRCDGCGGAVAARPGERLPACLFCGETALTEVEAAEHIEQPQLFAPFLVDEDAAQAAFAKFARSSWWYPSDLASSRLDLKRLLLPAWAFSGRIELHWTGLVSASNRAGKRPVAGHDTVDVDQVLVPASRSLRIAELHQLGAFDETALVDFEPEQSPAPFELSELSRSAATERGLGAMEDSQRQIVQQRNQLLSIRLSTILHQITGKPVLVPIWIGAYRYNDVVYRILVHGQTGRLVGRAPKSLWKILFVITVVIGVAAAIAMCLLGGGGLAALLNA